MAHQILKKDILEVCTDKNWFKKEKYWIKKLKSRNKKIGYNITEGGYGLGAGKNHPQYGKQLTSEHKNKVSKSMKGREFSLDHKKHLSETRKGIKFSEETRIKMALAKLGKQGYWSGKKRPLKSRIKMSISRKLYLSRNEGK